MAEVKNIEWVLSAVDRATPVFRGLESSMERVTAAHGMLVKSLGVFGGLLTVAGFTDMVKGSIESMNALHELSLKTGAAVETLSALRGVAKLSGTDMEAVGGYIQKLTKNMYEFADTGGGKAAAAFNALGISQAQAKSGMQDINAFLPELAKRLTETGTPSEQVALAMQLMGKSGAEALPFLHQLAQAGELHGKVTAEQARQAHEFEVALTKLSSGSTQLKNKFVAELLPSLTAITEEMLRAKKEGDSFFGVMIEGMKEMTRQLMGWNAAGDLKRLNDDMNQTYAALDAIRGGRIKASGMPYSEKEINDLKEHLRDVMQRRQVLLDQQRAVDALKEPEKTNTALIPSVAPGAGDPRERDRTAEKERAARAQVEGEERAAKETAEAWDYWGKIQIANHQEQVDANAKQWKAVFDEIDAQQEREIEAAQRYLDAQKALEKATKNSNTWARDLGLTFESAFEKAISNGARLRDVIQGLGNDLARLITRKAITEPLGNAATEALKNSGIGDWFKGMFSGGAAPQPELLNSYASGTDYVPQTGAYQLHQGEAVVRAADNTAGAGGGGSVNVNLTINAVDSRSVAQLMGSPAGRRMIIGVFNDAVRRSGQTGALPA